MMALGIVLICVALFLFVFSSLFWEGSLSLFGGLLANLGIILFVVGIVAIIDDRRKQAKIHEDDRALKNLARKLKDLSDSYMLNLSNSTIDQIVSSEDIFLEFSKYVPYGYPSVSTFCFNMATKCEEIVNKLKPSDFKAGVVYNHCMEYISSASKVLTEEDIMNIAAEYSADLPEELRCLSSKINYETSALSIIAEYAISVADGELISKINDYRKKRGFIK